MRRKVAVFAPINLFQVTGDFVLGLLDDHPVAANVADLAEALHDVRRLLIEGSLEKPVGFIHLGLTAKPLFALVNREKLDPVRA